MAVKLTEAGSHVANQRGYAGGQIVEEGEIVPPGVPLGSWMDPAPKPEKAAKAD